MLSTPKAKTGLFLASSLHDGLEDNNIIQITTLLLNKEANPNILIPSQGITPFHLVIGNDSETFAEEVTKLFLRHGGNPNVKSTDGLTPLHVAAAWGRLGVLELLLSNGADPLLVDDDGKCPFHYAFDEAHYEAVAILGKYCGKSFDEYSGPKYNLALEKILVTEGDVVAEYAVSEGTCDATATHDVSAFNTKNMLNNNSNFLENQNQSFAPERTVENNTLEPRCGCPKNANLIDTTSTKVSFDPNRKLLLCGNLMHDGEELHKDLKIVKLSSEMKKISPEIVDDSLFFSDRNYYTIEDLLLIESHKVNDSMPNVSLPKTVMKLNLQRHGSRLTKRQIVESSGITSQVPEKHLNKAKVIHKISRRYCTRQALLRRRTKTFNLQGWTMPHNRQMSSNHDKLLSRVHTTRQCVTKQEPYSADCSIRSKSPNFILTPKILMRPQSPKKSTNPVIDNKLQEIRTTSTNGISLGKGINRKNTDSYRTPLLARNFGNNGISVKYVCKKKQLAPEVSNLKTNLPTSSKRFHDMPIKVNTSIPNRNLTHLIKQNRKVTINQTQPMLTSSRCPRIFPTHALDKTYNEDVSNLAVDSSFELSPGDKIGKFLINCRGLSKIIAVNSEECMCDNRRDSRITDIQCIPDDVAHVKDEVNIPVKTMNSPTAPDLRISSQTDAYFENACGNYAEMNAKFRHISKVNQTAGSSKMTYDTNSIGRFSNIISGFLQCGEYCDCVKSKKTEIASYLIRYRSPRSHAGLLTSNSMMSNLVNSADSELDRCTKSDTCLNRPKLRDINDSLESRKPSDCSTDKHTWDRANDALSIELNKLFVSGSIHDNSLNHQSSVSIEEEYKYEDVEEGVILLERRLLTTPVSMPLIKTENEVSGNSGGRIEDASLESRLSSLPHSLVVMDSETLRRELTRLDRCPPGPITATTRHVYLRRLQKLQKCGPNPPLTVTIAVPPKFSAEIERTLRSENWISDLSQHEALELQVFGEFSNPDPTRRWREGINKSSFNYLLMDPRITKNLPRRGSDLSFTERWRIFLSAIFYIGKGKRSRPYSHLYSAFEEWKKGKRSTNDEKISYILGIWQSDCGVVCLHLFQNAIPVEAYTREAAMIDALGLDRLKNSKSGDYYGVAATWSRHQKRMLGVYLLYKAMNILMQEGERQLSPENIER
ncbi:uncharacterized protein LOC105692894 isoform X2 [Athalia rosae]|uniref:uncharacterized protein LOC105692894 isoform X2 n=1 Tax=Athalia rosae TaxID=37344 RepID=UPI002033BF22|nr:uncharacterized protein LOC105692894 isoform X2 [Athalia rosae]